jgi:hypothetical protein
MEIVSTLMQYAVSVLYFVILVSKFNFFHKILLIIGIYFVSKFNDNLNDYLQVMIKKELYDKNLINQKKNDSEKNIYGILKNLITLIKIKKIFFFNFISFY